jgi:pantetheine-phosphate adenylyltransferase
MMSDIRVGVYPGTFDPVTNGHLDIIRRSLKVVDKLIVGVAANLEKAPLFDLGERIAMVEEDATAAGFDGRVEVRAFNNLLTDFVTEVGGHLIVRGLRAVTDFEYEFQMTGMNAHLNPNIETVFLMASDRHQFIASRLVKEICRMGGDVSHFISPKVKAHLLERFASLKK